jgi:hypothetical protein
MHGAGDTVKIVTFVLNYQLFRTKVKLFIQNSLSLCTCTKQQQQQNKIVADLTNHGNAHFGRTQQPTNNLLALESN